VGTNTSRATGPESPETARPGRWAYVGVEHSAAAGSVSAMGKKSLARRLEWIESSPSLRALNGISIGLLAVGAGVVIVGFLVTFVLIAIIGAAASTA